MNGREKIEAAFSREGTAEIAAVICYEGIYIRDHWPQFEAGPWWLQEAPDIERQLAWRRRVIEKTGQDWFVLPLGASREEREATSLEVRPERVFRRDRRTGRAERLRQPKIGGWTAQGGVESVRPAQLADTPAAIDALIPLAPAFDPQRVLTTGREDLPAAMRRKFGEQLYPIRHVSSPLWSCYSLWGFEGMMTMIAARPDLVRYACGRFLTSGLRAVQLAAALGAAGIWIEECMTDMISPAAFAALNLPYLRPLVEEIRAQGMKSIYYFCGNPAGKWDLLLDAGADALSLEEGKKGFTIDIADVAERVSGRCVLLGNLDAINLLPQASEAELRAEIARQIAAGRRNGGRFIMSLGSPVTPPTSVERVRRYCEMVHEMSIYTTTALGESTTENEPRRRQEREETLI